MHHPAENKHNSFIQKSAPTTKYISLNQNLQEIYKYR